MSVRAVLGGRGVGYAGGASIGAAFVARAASLVIVLGAGFWLLTTSSVRRLDAGLFLHPVADRMMMGEVYDLQVLAAMDADLSVLLTDSFCDYQALQDLTIVRVALAESAFQGDDPAVANEKLTTTEAAARATLACSPGSTTAWTVLAWIEHIRHDDTPLLRAYLDRSFRFGPFEGWPLVRRMELLLALYPALNERDQARLRQAVNWIIASGISEFISDLYVLATSDQRGFLRDILAEAPARDQKRAAEFIRNAGEDIDLPSVEPLGSRPWK